MARQRLIQTNLSAESHGFGGNGITAKALYIWIGIPETVMERRFASSSMIVRGAFLQVENSMRKQPKTASDSFKRHLRIMVG